MADVADATPSIATVRAKRAARESAVQFISSSRLEYVYTPNTADAAIELLETMLMAKWHEGVIAGLDAALAKVNSR